MPRTIDSIGNQLKFSGKTPSNGRNLYSIGSQLNTTGGIPSGAIAKDPNVNPNPIDTTGFSAADFQVAATDLAIGEARDARESVREDLSPFRTQGAEIAPGLAALINDPNQQASLLSKNPFFGKIADRATQGILASQAAKGKAGAGETANIVQNKLFDIGTGIVNRDINNQFNLAAIGSNAAAGLGSSETASAGRISELLTQGGNARAAGVVAEQNRINNKKQQQGQLLTGLLLSDRTQKRDIEIIGYHKGTGLPVYNFKYNNSDKEHIGFMAQDVQKKHPSCVVDISGKLHVNYGELLNAD